MKDYRLPSFGLAIVGSKGIMKVNDSVLSLKLNSGKFYKWLRHDLDDHVNFLLGDSEYYREDEAFITSIIDGDKVESSFKSASKVDYIIDQVKKEAKNDST